jgi:protein TonB
LTLETLDARSPARPIGSAGSRWGALVLSVTIQTVLIIALVYGLMPKQTHERAPALQVSIVAPAARSRPKPPAPPPVELRVHAPVAITPPELQLAIESSPVIALVPSAAAVPSHPVAPPPPPPAEGTKALTFEQRLLAAVQAAVDGHYPSAARLMHQEGQADVGFDYFDGQVSHIALVQSSGSALIDKAALATVHDARYPPPPEKLLHQQQHYEVWVKFRLERGG